MDINVLAPPAVFIVIVLVWLVNCLNILREYERAVVFRLGRVLKREKGPGLVLIVWPIDKLVKVSLRVVTWEVPPQDVITRDNVSLKVNAVVYFRVVSASKAILEVENFRYAVEQAAQTGLRSVLGEVELDDLLSQREKLNESLQRILDEQTEPWGIKVTQVQVKQVDLPQEMQRAIAAQAEAERTRRAKVIAAEGEFQASERLAQAAAVLNREPAAITLRYLQTLIEIGVEKNTTIVFPLPLDLLAGLATKIAAADSPAAATRGAGPLSSRLEIRRRRFRGGSRQRTTARTDRAALVISNGGANIRVWARASVWPSPSSPSRWCLASRCPALPRHRASSNSASTGKSNR
ncbi:MAG TPA: slipin family protein [Vicinamibacterales bacterium]|nr:slipin family protein [Vicinamibacterales bacterium]